MARLKHPHTVTVFDFGDCDGVCYLAMELLEGRTLRRAIADEAPFDEARAAYIGRQIARSLREAHGLGVVHRDLKPANVFLVAQDDEADFVKVLDFGLAKPIEGEGEALTTSHRLLGSPRYMAPEQIRGERVDERTDVYALGVVLYEMAAGRPPFQGATPMQTMTAHVSARPPALDGVSEAFAALVARALAKDPAGRFQSMSEMLEALAPLAPTVAGSDAPPARTPEGGMPRARLSSAPRHPIAAPARPASSPVLPATPPRLAASPAPSAEITAPVPALSSADVTAPVPAVPSAAVTAPFPIVPSAEAMAPVPVVSPADVTAPVPAFALASALTPTSTAFSFSRPSALASVPMLGQRESAPSGLPPLAAPAVPRVGRGRVVAAVGASLAAAFVLAGSLLYVQVRSLGPQPRIAIASLAAPAAMVGTSLGAPPPAGAAPADAAKAAGAANAVGGAFATDVTDKMVHLETEPPGASVRLGSIGGPELCPSTPCQVDLGAPSSEEVGASIYFVREGFAPTPRRVGGSGGRVVVRLKPARRAPAERPAQAERAHPPD